MENNKGVIVDLFKYGKENGDKNVTLSWTISNSGDFISSVTNLKMGETQQSGIKNPHNSGKANDLKDKTIIITSLLTPVPETDVKEGTVKYVLTCGDVSREYTNTGKIGDDGTIYLRTTITIIE